MYDQINKVLDSIVTKVCADQSLAQLVPKRTVGYVFSRQLIFECNRLPKVKGRVSLKNLSKTVMKWTKFKALLVHELIKAYGLTNKCRLIEAIAATDCQMRSFHSEEYLNFVKRISKDLLSQMEDDLNEEFTSDEFGIGYDCPPIPRLYELMTHIAGSSICAATAIIEKRCDIAINWFGGWHHSNRDEASGYCYTNDIVLAVLHLLDNHYDRVLYIDLDLHHGDAVQNAFAHTNKVLTLSFHKYEMGFFPGTGDTNDVGFGTKGKYYSINIPLKDGMTDECYVNVFTKVLDKVKSRYASQVIICQCGADALSGDPMNGFNLTIDSYSQCLRYLIAMNKPLILLGGGGYHSLNTARLWTSLTACALNETLDNEIPDHSCFLAYRPTYELNIDAGLRPNLNSNLYIESVLEKVFQNLNSIK